MNIILAEVMFFSLFLAVDRSGSISFGEFVSVPESKENPLVKRVVDIFESDLNGEVDFKGKTILFKIKIF